MGIWENSGGGTLPLAGSFVLPNCSADVLVVLWAILFQDPHVQIHFNTTETIIYSFYFFALLFPRFFGFFIFRDDKWLSLEKKIQTNWWG